MLNTTRSSQTLGNGWLSRRSEYVGDNDAESDHNVQIVISLRNVNDYFP